MSERGGVCTYAELLAAGVTRQGIAIALDLRELERARKGVYVDPRIPDQLKQAVRVGGRLACISAAPLLGLRVLETPRALHVEVDRHASHLRLRREIHSTQRRQAEPGVRVHWSGGVAATMRGAIVSIEDCLVHMLGCLPPIDALCALDSARERVPWRPERPQLLDDAGFSRLLERLPATTRAIAARSDAGSQAVAETVARERFRAAGIPVRTQVRLPGGFFADLLIGDRLVFEADGEGPHSAPGAFDRDRARAGWIKATGYTHVSFSHNQILREWDMVLGVVEMLMRRGLHEWGAVHRPS